MAAAAAGLLLAGALLGAGGLWQWQRVEAARQGGATTTRFAAAEPVWVQRAALAHSVYVPEPRHPVEVRAQEEHLSRWLTRRTTVPVKLFDLQDQGFELMGGRLLPDSPNPGAQLMYQDAEGRRVTVYLRKPEQNGSTPVGFRYERHGELGMFYWIEPGVGYALVGALPKERLLALAQAIDAQNPAQTMPTR
jgi:anti-sigma factor RsiW